jgi:tetraacyldisaccharide 4'-kinase
VRASWIDRRQESLARRTALLPLVPAAWAFGAGARAGRWLYASGVRSRAKLPLRVVSVGSVLSGGTGKTPLAAWVAVALARRGHRVALARRPYRSARGAADVAVVSDGRRALSRVEVAGDESWVLVAHAAGVPVLAARDRGLAAARALSAFGADVLVLDDGFQHHRLHRDVEIATLDAGVGFGNRRLLPRGPLREPPAALRHADAVVVVDGELDPGDERLLGSCAPAALRAAARRVPVSLRPLRGGRGEPPRVLEGAAVGLLAGLGNPAALRRTVAGLGARVVAERLFGDHHRYRPRDLRQLSRDACLWITTEKDAVKLVPAWAGGADVRVLRIELAPARPRELVTWLEARLVAPAPGGAPAP